MVEARLSRWTPLAVGLSISSLVAIMVWSQARSDIDVLGDLRGFDRTVLWPALALHVMMHVLWASRLRLLAGGLGVRLRGVAAWRLATSGQFAGAVTPGRFGAEALRLTILVRSGASGVHASRLVLSDRTVDMVFFLGAGTLGTAMLVQVFGPDAAALRTAAIVALALLLTLMLLVFGGLSWPRPIASAGQGIVSGLYRVLRRPAPDVAVRIEGLFRDVRAGVVTLLRERPLRVGLAIALSMAIWSAEFGVLWFVLKGFGHTVPYATVFAAGILLTLLGPVAITPGGAGIVEVAAVILLGSLVPGLSPVFVLVWRALTFYYDVIVGGIVAGWTLRHPQRL